MSRWRLVGNQANDSGGLWICRWCIPSIADTTRYDDLNRPQFASGGKFIDFRAKRIVVLTRNRKAIAAIDQPVQVIVEKPGAAIAYRNRFEQTITVGESAIDDRNRMPRRPID